MNKLIACLLTGIVAGIAILALSIAFIISPKDTLSIIDYYKND